MSPRLVSAGLLLLVLACLGGDKPRRSLAAPGDWPGWRGPERTGVSGEKGLLPSWPKEGPKLLWSISGLGGGYAAPAVVGSKLFVMGSRAPGGSGEEYVHALTTKDGERLWSVKVGKVGENTGPPHPGPRATPTVAGERLWTLGSDGDLVCLSTNKGKLLWHKHLKRDFHGVRDTWAYCESPLVDGDLLICTPGGREATMLALEKNTGKVVWKAAKRDGNVAGYASAIVARAGKRKLYVQFLGPGLIGADAKTGELLFHYRRNVGAVSANTPIYHDGHVFTTAGGLGSAGGDALLKLVETEKGVEAKEVYLHRNLMTFHGGVIRLGEYLYGTSGTGLVCLDFRTGSVKWRHRSIGQGSLAAAEGRLYLRNTQGQMALVEASPDGYREKGRFRQPKRSRFNTFAHPVIAGGRLYLRDDDLLLCYDLTAKGGRP
jgi:outer membrane protein assembly factor BamB